MPRKPKNYTATSNVSSRTRALRGSTGLTEAQEERANALLKQLAYDLYGENWSGITTKDRNALCRKVASVMRKDGNSITTEQVRMASQRMRSTPEVRTAYPVDLDAEAYAYIVDKAEMDGTSRKAVASAIIREHWEQHA